MDNVGAVQTSAEAGLDNGYIHFLVAEIGKSHRRGKFEERRLERFEVRAVAFDEADNVVLRYFLAIDTDALPEVHQMRRGIKPYAVTRFLKNGCQ